jgi:Stage II sporulation protein E (SpoIIE)
LISSIRRIRMVHRIPRRRNESQIFRAVEVGWIASAIWVLVVLVGIDLTLVGRDNIAVGLVIVPFLASVGARPRIVAGLGGLALVAAVVVALADGLSVPATLAGVAVLGWGTAVAARAALLRTGREQRLAAVSTVAETAQRASPHPTVPSRLGRGGGEVRRLDASSPTCPLAIGSDPTIDTYEIPACSRLLLYTDGLLEARDHLGRLFDLERAAGTLAAGSLGTGIATVIDHLNAHADGRVNDDVALVLLQPSGTDLPLDAGEGFVLGTSTACTSTQTLPRH